MALSLKKLWSGADFWDKQENQRQRQEFARQAPKPAPQKPLWQQATQQVANRLPIVGGAIKAARGTNSTSRVLDAIETGVARSFTGGVQGLSGLYDLATPGKGLNRVTQATQKVGAEQDQFVKKNNLNTALYKGGQLGGEALQFIGPGMVTNALSKTSKAGRVINGAREIKAGSGLLPEASNIATKSLNWATKPANAANIITNTIQNSGYRTASGQDVSPGSVAADLGVSVAFGGALSGAGALAQKAGSKLQKPKPFTITENVPVETPKQPLKIKAGVPLEKNPLAPKVGLKIVDNNPTGLKIVDNSAPKQVQGAARQSMFSKLLQDDAGGYQGGTTASERIAAKNKVSLKQPEAPVKTSSIDPNERNLSLAQKLSPDRVIRENITNPLEQKIQQGIFNAQTSENPIARGVGRFAQGFSKEAGVTDELLRAKQKLHGGIETGKLLREDIADAGKVFDKTTKERVWASLDPEQATKTGTSLKTALTPEESIYREGLKKQLDDVTQGNLERGLITPEQAANGTYIKRGYSIFEEGTDNSKAYQQTRESLLKQFKGRKDVTNELLDSAIKDPSYLVAKKTAESNAAWAMVDYGKHLSSTGLTSDVARPGYTQLPSSKVFGEAAGKYVPKGVAEDFTGFQYNNGIISAFNDMITAYDSLGIRKAKKELLTIFNPAVRVGNQFSNRVVFSNLNGINPIQFQKNMMVAKSQIKTKGPLYREAVSQGLTGLDITQADFAKRIADATGEPNLAVKAIEYAKKSYSAADDQSRLAAYITHRNRGYPAEEAARLTQRGFQDYKSVGFFYDIAAKTPLIGNAFVRFAGDATRIAKNAALDHPLRSASTIALWATFVNGMSKISGESPEDKKTREDRYGAPKLPFSDISTAVQTPWGEVNVSRFLPFYQLNETQGAIGKLLPLSKSPITFKDGKIGADPAAFNDPLLGQFVQLAADKDFRGKSIKDPENVGQFVDPLSSSDQKKNQAGYLAAGNLPLGRELNSLYSAAKGGEDLYGKKRSLPQAAARAMGVKVEQYGPEQAKDQRATNEYFTEKEKIDAQIKGLPAKDQEAYKRLTGYYKLREKTANEFSPGEQRQVKAPVYEFPEDKWKEYTTSPKLYDMAIKKKEEDNKRQGTPIQPEFDKRLSTEFRKQLINNKSLAPGEDVEADERMYSNSEWDAYQKIKQEYTDKASKYYPQSNGEFVDELVKHKQGAFPTKPPAKKAYDDAYAKYAKGQGPKPAFDDSIAAAKDKYAEDKRVWTNTERKARGLPPISKEVWDNVTFGFESDEEKVYKQLKYGKGYGGYGGGGGGGGASGYAGKSKVSVKGTVAKPTVKTKDPGKLKGSVKYATTSKPKVTTKKSLV